MSILRCSSWAPRTLWAQAPPSVQHVQVRHKHQPFDPDQWESRQQWKDDGFYASRKRYIFQQEARRQYAIGDVRHSQGKREEALACYRAAMRHAPGNIRHGLRKRIQYLNTELSVLAARRSAHANDMHARLNLESTPLLDPRREIPPHRVPREDIATVIERARTHESALIADLPRRPPDTPHPTNTNTTNLHPEPFSPRGTSASVLKYKSNPQLPPVPLIDPAPPPPPARPRFAAVFPTPVERIAPELQWFRDRDFPRSMQHGSNLIPRKLTSLDRAWLRGEVDEG
ncbi:hypothetical protein B0H10DRAFT_140725 [Mycena sp. CBHHK59/15]|nr:hypothetical protein B0H10DRAFT_140725 [Mycena sp. CBHHK59/15]